jgi:N-acetylmuramoyl-L-alanine amidase
MRSAGFVVLKAPDIPSVLVELGYLSNAEDAKNLVSDAWRDKAADSIVAAIQSFFAARPAVAQTQVR